MGYDKEALVKRLLSIDGNLMSLGLKAQFGTAITTTHAELSKLVKELSAETTELEIVQENEGLT